MAKLSKPAFVQLLENTLVVASATCADCGGQLQTSVGADDWMTYCHECERQHAEAKRVTEAERDDHSGDAVPYASHAIQSAPSNLAILRDPWRYFNIEHVPAKPERCTHCREPFSVYRPKVQQLIGWPTCGDCKGKQERDPEPETRAPKVYNDPPARPIAMTDGARWHNTNTSAADASKPGWEE